MRQSPTSNTDAFMANRLFGFVHMLRMNGYNLNSTDIKAAHLVVTQGALKSEVMLRDSLRSIFCQSHSQWHEFPILFKIYWWAPGAGEEQSDTTATSNQTRGSEATGLSYFSESQAQEKTLAGHTDTIDVHSGGASDARTLSQRDFRFVFNPHDMRRIERIVDDISRRETACAIAAGHLSCTFDANKNLRRGFFCYSTLVSQWKSIAICF